MCIRDRVYAFNKQGIKATYSSSILLMIFIVYQSVLVVYTSIIMLLKFVYFSKLYSGFFSLAFIGFIINLVVISSLFLGAKSEKLQNFLSNNAVKVLAKLHIVKSYEAVSYTHLDVYKRQTLHFGEEWRTGE